MELIGAAVVLLVAVGGAGAGVEAGCVPGERLAAPHSCRHYWHCDSTFTWLLQACPPPLFFHQNSASCRVERGVCRGWQPCQQGGQYPDSRPGRYFSCQQGHLVLKHCPPLHIYHAPTTSCRLPSKLYSERDSRLLSGNSHVSTNVPLKGSSFHEPTCQDGEIKIDFNDCQRYFQCNNDPWRKKQCPFMMGFDGRECKYMFKCPKTVEEEKRWAPDNTTCVDGQVMAYPGDCNYYYECHNDPWESKTCPWLQRFDSKTKQCKRSLDRTCFRGPEPHLPCTDGEKVIDAEDCQKYFVCINHPWRQSKCPIPQVFNKETLKCETHLHFWCSTQKKSVRNSTQQDDECKEGTKRSVDSDCHAYEVCTHDPWVSMECGLLHKFDPIQKECHLKPVGCFPDSNPTPVPSTVPTIPSTTPTISTTTTIPTTTTNVTIPTTTPTTTTNVTIHTTTPTTTTNVTIPTTTPTTTTTATIPTVTPSTTTVQPKMCTGNDKKPLVADCQSYLVCEDGAEVRHTCPPLQDFDKKRLECDWFWNVSCDSEDCSSGPRIRPVDYKACYPYYYLCQDGKYILEPCLYNTVFDPTIRKCRSIKVVNCTKFA